MIRDFLSRLFLKDVKPEAVAPPSMAKEEPQEPKRIEFYSPLLYPDEYNRIAEKYPVLTTELWDQRNALLLEAQQGRSLTFEECIFFWAITDLARW